MLWKEGKPLQSDVLIGTACFFISVFIKSLSSAMWADDEHLTNTIVYFKKNIFLQNAKWAYKSWHSQNCYVMENDKRNVCMHKNTQHTIWRRPVILNFIALFG